jgi:hypothetical protein
MNKIEEVIRRLRRPPSVANWVRHNFKRSDRTRRGLLNFAKAPPLYSLSDIYGICGAIVTDQLSFHQAMRCLEGVKDKRAKEAGKEIVPLFHKFAQEAQLDGLAAFKGFSSPYPIGRANNETLSIPVTPTFTILNEGKLVPVFVIGWASMPLNDYQKRLLSTIIHDAILTQQDFIGSDALIVCTPRNKRTKARDLMTWKATEYADLSQDELQEQFSRYRSALEEVIRALRAE